MKIKKSVLKTFSRMTKYLKVTVQIPRNFCHQRGSRVRDGQSGDFSRVLSCGKVLGLGRNAGPSALKEPWDLGRRILGK